MELGGLLEVLVGVRDAAELRLDEGAPLVLGLEVPGRGGEGGEVRAGRRGRGGAGGAGAEGRYGCGALAASDLVVLSLDLVNDGADLRARDLQLLQSDAQLRFVEVLEGAAVVQPRRGVGGGPVDDLGARVRAPVLPLALEAVLVPDAVPVLLVELLARDVLRELGTPVGVRLLVRQACARVGVRG